MGDTVHIRTTPVMAIRDYVKGQKLTYDNPEPELVDLTIDKGKYWAFQNDDIDKAQSDYNFVANWTADAAMQIKIAQDRGILADVYTQAHASNKGATAGAISGNVNLGTTGSPLALTKTNIIDTLVRVGQVLDEQNVAEDQRYIVLPAWAGALIKMSDLKDASLTGDNQSILRNGRIGMVDRLEIYISNLLSTYAADSATNCIFGQRIGLTYAAQLTQNEGPMRSPDFFGDLYRGLVVYGYKVVKPQAFGHLYVSQG